MTLVYRATLDKKGLADVPVNERTLFFALGHCLNEVNALQKQALWSAHFDHPEDALNKANVSLSLLHVRLLAGKLKEGQILLQTRFFPHRLEMEYSNLLNQDASEALQRLKRYFGGANLIDVIRSNYSFHYSPQEIDDALTDVPDELELFVSDDVGNSLYYACEVLANRALLKSVGYGDEITSFRRLVVEVYDVGGDFLRFGMGFMSAFLGRYSKQLWGEVARPTELGTLTPILAVELPWFTDNSALVSTPSDS